MGKATRWLKSLFGIKGDREHKHSSQSEDHRSMKLKHASSSSSSPFVSAHSESNSRHLCHNPANISPAEASWLQSFYTEKEKEQNKHAIAVAAATAAAADAAVAAAHAAVAVVRLTSNGRGTMFGGAGHEKMWAAIKIQTIFRGYLARKALRALKGLVKLQALVRGYLVRKQATKTLHSRVQFTVLSQKSVRLMNTTKNEAHRVQNRARKSMERFDETRSEYTGPIHSRRLSSCFEATVNSVDRIPKIVEVDTFSGRSKSRSRRTNMSKSDFGDNPSFHALSSSLPISIPEQRNSQNSDWGLTGEEECRFSTTHSTPRFTHSCSCETPKSVCSTTDNYFFRKYGNFPNYMASTQSFKAKLRSHSAPRQRPEPGKKKRLSLSELMMESRNSLSEVRMQRSSSKVQEVVDFKNAVMVKLQKSTESA